MAPAFWALISLLSNVHVPRRMRAMWFRRLPAGSGLQARPLWSRVATSVIGAVIGLLGAAPSPSMATNGVKPGTSASAANVLSLVVAPTAIAEGAVAGEEIVFRSVPLLPAATTTIPPAWGAR